MKKKILIIFSIISITVLGIVSIYLINNDKNTEWKITQFGDNVGSQMMCYTVEGNKKGLIIIDGGYKDNQEQFEFLKNKINENNNVVDAWIITHFDSDHAGVFLKVQEELKDIKIKKIFVQDAPEDLEVLKENASWEDDWSTYEECMKLDLPQKIKVHSGEEYKKLIGLNLKVLCSYDEWIDEKTGNLLNNGSIVFKLYGKEQSILFTGDIQDKPISEYLINNNKEDLKTDYLQVPHHGNNSMGEEFYKLVNPKVSFFSAPDWLMNNINNVSWFTVKENRKTLEEMGSQILWYNTSPNEIVLK